MTTSKEITLKLKSEALFSKFAAIWGQKWLKSFEDSRVYNEAVKIWAKVLSEIPQENIQFAIHKCSKLYDFPPSVAEFIAAAWDIPSFEVIKYCENNDSDFCYILNKRIGIINTKLMTNNEIDSLLKSQYEALKEQFLLGECKELNKMIEGEKDEQSKLFQKKISP